LQEALEIANVMRKMNVGVSEHLEEECMDKNAGT
jgi:hypothetical protein